VGPHYRIPTAEEVQRQLQRQKNDFKAVGPSPGLFDGDSDEDEAGAIPTAEEVQRQAERQSRDLKLVDPPSANFDSGDEEDEVGDLKNRTKEASSAGVNFSNNFESLYVFTIQVMCFDLFRIIELILS
jgi:hypothetical protein